MLDVLAQRDALDVRAGRLLTEVAALRWTPAREAAAACGLNDREAVRLRGLAKAIEEAGQMSAPTPTLDGSTAASDEE